MRALFESGSGSIEVVFSDGGQARAHSAILGARSPVLRAMWSSPMQESVTQRVEMQCSEETGRHFLYFMYTGELPEKWPSSLNSVCEMGVLADYYQVGDLDAAFGSDKLESVRDMVFDPGFTAGEFWEHTVSFLMSPGLPRTMREALVDSFVDNGEISWGDDLFLALCIATHLGAEDVEDRCLGILRQLFSQQPDSDRSLPREANPFDDTPFKLEFNDRRLRLCRRRSSDQILLKSFIRFQAVIMEVMNIRTKMRVYPTAGAKCEAFSFNVFQAGVQACLAEAAPRVLHVASLPELPEETEGDSDDSDEEAKHDGSPISF